MTQQHCPRDCELSQWFSADQRTKRCLTVVAQRNPGISALSQWLRVIPVTQHCHSGSALSPSDSGQSRGLPQWLSAVPVTQGYPGAILWGLSQFLGAVPVFPHCPSDSGLSWWGFSQFLGTVSVSQHCPSETGLSWGYPDEGFPSFLAPSQFLGTVPVT